MLVAKPLLGFQTILVTTLAVIPNDIGNQTLGRIPNDISLNLTATTEFYVTSEMQAIL